MRWAYIRQWWDFGDTIEVEEKHTGRYGARGQRREKPRKPTPEAMQRQNQWKRERDLRRLIKWNWGQNDYWMTITYRKGDRPTWEQMSKDIQNLLTKVRRRYKKYDQELKYIYRLGIGKRGGPHIHILVNRFSTAETGTDMIFSELWDKGHVNFRHLQETGSYQALAEYIAKPLEEWEPEKISRYHPSRNLIRKDPQEKEVKRRNLIDKRGQGVYPQAKKGYYIDPDSVRIGINPVTGFAYRHYTMVRLQI